jgi:hypothetical protein
VTEEPAAVHAPREEDVVPSCAYDGPEGIETTLVLKEHPVGQPARALSEPEAGRESLAKVIGEPGTYVALVNRIADHAVKIEEEQSVTAHGASLCLRTYYISVVFFSKPLYDA